MPAPTPQSEALTQAREHGLWGRADSPPDWQQALQGATAGEPILVKDPSDPRDDFFLVPMRAADPAAHRSAWIMLDPVTLQLREAALLDHWKFPAFPEESDAQRIAQTTLLLPDGTSARFPPSALKPNRNNLVWRASDASILPYWPLKEWIAPHPVTAEPVSIYVTQESEILTSLAAETPSAPVAPKKSTPLRLGLSLIAGVLIGLAANAWWHGQQVPIDPVRDTIIKNDQVEIERLSRLVAEVSADAAQKEKQIQSLTMRLAEAEANASQRDHQIKSLSERLKEAERSATQAADQLQILRKRLAELETRKAFPGETQPFEIPKENPRPSPAAPLKEQPKELSKPQPSARSAR